MDAREKLRQYLEQRRDMGESELVLDTMTVDEALRIVGAKTGAAKPMATVGGSTASVPRVAAPDTSDWRTALRETGAAPSRPGHPDATLSAAKGSEGPALPDVASGLVVGTPGSELFGGSLASLDSLDAVAKHIASCTRCPLYSTAINHVPGEGNPNAGLVCVGEAPGATEDELGRPFVGASGQLLTKILAAVNLAREDVFIVNVLKHRPPGNRNPLPEEVKACSPYLVRQIELIKPKVIVAWGTFAAQTLLDTKLSIGKLRGQIHRYYGVPLIVTYHPAALLRNPNWKRPTWEDVQLARRILDSASPGA
jgi:uracil-DNA glycosylase